MGSTKTPKVPAWTEKHVREARATLYQLAAYSIAKNYPSAVGQLRAARRARSTATREGFLAELEDGFVTCSRALGIVRRVCARAEGREVVTVETFFRVRLINDRYLPGEGCDLGADSDVQGADRFPDRAYADWAAQDIPGACPVRVRLTRSRILRAKKG